jgi:hypothetical protein
MYKIFLFFLFFLFGEEAGCIYWFTTTWLILGLVFIAYFNNISAILWRSVLLVEETGGPGENH